MHHDLVNQMHQNRGIGEQAKHVDRVMSDDQFNQALSGDLLVGEAMLKKKAEEAKAMRDFLAYKQFQKELDKDQKKQEQSDFYKMIDDENRRRDEKERRWRQYYERFANDRDFKTREHWEKYILPEKLKEERDQYKYLGELERIQKNEMMQKRAADGRTAMAQDFTDDFNRRMIEEKNKQNQYDKLYNA